MNLVLCTYEIGIIYIFFSCSHSLVLGTRTVKSHTEYDFIFLLSRSVLFWLRSAIKLSSITVRYFVLPLQVAAVKAPGFGDNRKATLHDIAVSTGALVFNDEASMVKIEDVQVRNVLPL